MGWSQRLRCKLTHHLSVILATVFSGRDTECGSEAAVEVTLIAKSGAVRDLRNCCSRPQQFARSMYAYVCLILVRWHSHVLVKHSHQIVRAQAGDITQ